MKKINNTVKDLLIAVSAVVIYVLILKKFDAISVFWTRRESLLVEGPIVLFIYFLFLLGMKKGVARYFCAAVPVIVFYVVFEVYYKIWNTPFKIITIRQLPELLDVLRVSQILMLFFVALVVLSVVFSIWNFKNYKKTIFSLFLLLFIFISVDVHPQLYINYFDISSGEVVPLRDTDNIHKNGRLSMTLYWEAMRRDAILKLKNVPGSLDDTRDLNNISLVQQADKKRNVHLVVLESFFDPSLFDGVIFSEPPLHPKLSEVFRGELGRSFSPVFGGRSAQAEFEVLTGVPAFAEFSDVDFNIFSGAATHGLPWVLRKSGYLTIATNSYMLNAFNADNAYRGLFFEEIYFPKEYAKGRATYIERGDIGRRIFMPDEYLLKKNLEFVADKIANSPDTPIFNYVLGVDGHWPFDIPEDKKTDRIKVLEPKDFDKELLEKFVNQIYYRSKAVAEYVDGINKIDPDSVIIIIGDHLPRLELGLWEDMGPELYKQLRYLKDSPDNHRYTLIAGMVGGQPIRFDEISHYNVPEVILDFITAGKYCKLNECYSQDRRSYHDRYLGLMSRAAVN